MPSVPSPQPGSAAWTSPALTPAPSASIKRSSCVTLGQRLQPGQEHGVRGPGRRPTQWRARGDGRDRGRGRVPSAAADKFYATHFAGDNLALAGRDRHHEDGLPAGKQVTLQATGESLSDVVQRPTHVTQQHSCALAAASGGQMPFRPCTANAGHAAHDRQFLPSAWRDHCLAPHRLLVLVSPVKGSWRVQLNRAPPRSVHVHQLGGSVLRGKLPCALDRCTGPPLGRAN